MTLQFEETRLEALLESSRLLNGALDVDQLLQHLLRTVMGHFLARRGLIAVSRESTLEIAHLRGLASLKAGTPFREEEARLAGIETFLPIGNEASPIGVLGIGPPASGSIRDADRDFLSAILGIAAGAIENVRATEQVRSLNAQLDRKINELRTLLEFVRGLTGVTDPDDIARMLGLTIAGQWAIQRYAIVAWKPEQPSILRQKGVTVGSADALRQTFGELQQSVRATEVGEAPVRELLAAQKIAGIVPIRSGEATIGIVLLGARPAGVAFSDDDFAYTSGFADQAAVAFENAWNFRETLEKKKIEKELELAAEIQRRLLPASMPELDGLDIFAKTRPARHVGGDYFDAMPRSDGTYLFCVADVSGKGIAASLLMSSFQATLRALVSADMPLAQLAARMNDLIWASTAANKYVTAIFVILDPATGRGRFVNAGHNDGLLVRSDGTIERLKAGGLSVGLLPTRPYREEEIMINEGDLIALYSDGVTEANDPDENEFEDDRLIECLRNGTGGSAEAVVAATYLAVDAFAGAAPQYDDITMMVLRKT